ncbi:putative transcriptional regulator, LysR family protein [Dietzia sp. NCCP-2495]|uniref:LysR family transcriptional regulator substrate-binding protein n=1 Tax=Dietzia sp. NCCP-2495 TaxID=2934675 RepID=UPI0022315408|nr:LysR family transcriptional regulator substrate-binding protein [Dietzia sp. NCCP-2495]GLB63918.1 putative transcriptional regulator, LysR family protein [Dietzia sp. NCCP-2495]
MRQGLTIGYVPGVQPDKWLTRWRERHPDIPVAARRVGDPRTDLAHTAGENGFDVVFFRESADDSRTAPEGLLRVPLYTETMAVLAEKDHELGAFDSLTKDDLEGETWLDPVDTLVASPDEVASAVDLVAANVGLLVLPLPYARSLSRRDVVIRPLEGVPATRMGVAWSSKREGDVLIDEFVGIVRGRKAASSRGGSDAPREKRTAREKAAAKAQARAERSGKVGGGTSGRSARGGRSTGRRSR